METLSLWQDRTAAVERVPAPVPERVDDLVVGAGLAGLVTGVLLARAGRKVAVIDARPLGSGTTARTTAKVSLLQGTKLSRLLRRHPAEVGRAYVESNRVAMDWLLGFCSRRGVPFQTREAVTYAGAPDQVEATRAEFEAAASLGLPVHWREDLDVPFPVHGAVLLADQAQFDPVQVLQALAAELVEAGGTLHEEQRLVGVSVGGLPEARLAGGGRVVADQVVLATGTPVLDRTLCFARLSPARSYLLAYRGDPGTDQMLISAGSPTRSLRQVGERAEGEEPIFLVGGAGHVVGRAESPLAHLDELRAWTSAHVPGAVETHAWSAQDYRSLDELPVAGTLAPSGDRIHVATGFDKWGMTNAVAAARRIAAAILGTASSTPWPESSHPSPGSLLRAVGLNLQVAGLLVSDWAEVELGGSSADATVVRHRFVPTVPGENGGFVGVCTHLGGILHWNDAERTWDCPLHGSRFGPDGDVLEGPATRPLRRRAS